MAQEGYIGTPPPPRRSEEDRIPMPYAVGFTDSLYTSSQRREQSSHGEDRQYDFTNVFGQAVQEGDPQKRLRRETLPKGRIGEEEKVHRFRLQAKVHQRVLLEKVLEVPRLKKKSWPSCPSWRHKEKPLQSLWPVSQVG